MRFSYQVLITVLLVLLCIVPAYLLTVPAGAGKAYLPSLSRQETGAGRRAGHHCRKGGGSEKQDRNVR